jgi:hypothetical protein
MSLPDEPITGELVTERSEQQIAVEDQIIGVGLTTAALKMRFAGARIE